MASAGLRFDPGGALLLPCLDSRGRSDGLRARASFRPFAFNSRIRHWNGCAGAEVFGVSGDMPVYVPDRGRNAHTRTHTAICPLVRQRAHTAVIPFSALLSFYEFLTCMKAAGRAGVRYGCRSRSTRGGCTRKGQWRPEGRGDRRLWVKATDTRIEA